MVGNAKIDGNVYINPASGGYLSLKDGASIVNGYPRYGIGYNSGNVGVSGDNFGMYVQGGFNLLFSKKVVSSWSHADTTNPAFPYLAGAVSQNGQPGMLTSNIHQVNIDGELLVNMNIGAKSVNADSVCGCNLEFNYGGINNVRAGLITCDNIFTTGGVQYVPSDKRLKRNIQAANLDMCYSNTKYLELKYYAWADEVDVKKMNGDKHKLGWIAQEIEQIFPKSIQPTELYGMSNCKAIGTDQIIATLYGTVQKLQQLYESQQEQIDKLNNTITILQSQL
jgi:hypothetical protein